jgi:hypothetical protein
LHLVPAPNTKIQLATDELMRHNGLIETRTVWLEGWEMDAYEEGKKAFYSMARWENPYKYDSYNWSEWNAGYDSESEEAYK